MRLQLVVFCALVAHARIFLSPSGNESWRSESANSFLNLPNSTVVGEQLLLLDTLEALLNETRALRARVELLEAQPPTPGCAWNGTMCSCYFNSTSIPDVMLVTGSTCVNGVLQSVRPVAAFLATGIFDACNPNSSQWDFSACDGFFV